MPSSLLRRLVWWVGAVLIGLRASGFAACSERARHLRVERSPCWMLLALSSRLTRTWFRGAQGSGIPQTIAALEVESESVVARLSPRIAFGKMLLTVLGCSPAARSAARVRPCRSAPPSCMRSGG